MFFSGKYVSSYYSSADSVIRFDKNFAQVGYTNKYMFLSLTRAHDSFTRKYVTTASNKGIFNVWHLRLRLTP